MTVNTFSKIFYQTILGALLCPGDGHPYFMDGKGMLFCRQALKQQAGVYIARKSIALLSCKVEHITDVRGGCQLAKKDPVDTQAFGNLHDTVIDRQPKALRFFFKYDGTMVPIAIQDMAVGVIMLRGQHDRGHGLCPGGFGASLQGETILGFASRQKEHGGGLHELKTRLLIFIEMTQQVGS